MTDNDRLYKKIIHEVERAEYEGEEPEPRRTSGPRLRQVGNTGPKSVIADYHESQSQINELRKQQSKEIEKKAKNLVLSNVPKSDDELEDEDLNKILQELEQDGFLDDYQQKRMNEMNFHNFKTFGVLGNVSSKTFLKAIEEENPDVLIILHLYSNRLKICQEINQMMTELATKFPRIKFLKGVANELSQGFDDLALPSLVIYKGGKLIDSLIRFTDKLPSNFDIDHFEHFLKKQNFLF